MEAREHLPHFWCGLAEVGESELLVWRAPDGLGGEVEVTAKQEVQLPGAEHEVEG